MQITTTLQQILNNVPEPSFWEKFLEWKADTGANEEFPMSDILECPTIESHVNNCVSSFRSRRDLSNLWRQYALWCVRRIEHLMQDPRSTHALAMAERNLHGDATDEELKVAARAAMDASYHAYDYDSASYNAASAAAHLANWFIPPSVFIPQRAAHDKGGHWAWTIELQAQEACLRHLLNTGEMPK
jgi:hypothetical protein